MIDFLADNWLALAGAVTGIIGLGVAIGSMRISRSVRALAHVADLESRIGGVSHDNLGRPTLKLQVKNFGPGVALDVNVRVTEIFVGPSDPRRPGWWHKPTTTKVAGRLRPDHHLNVEVPASGDNPKLIEVRWKDGGGRHMVHPLLPRPPRIY